MIPTVYKTKIAHTHSYPLGAQTISEALDGVPQLGELKLHFYHPSPRHSGQGMPYRVVKVQYRRMSSGLTTSKDLIERGWMEPSWTITVGAVPRTLRHSVQQRLIAEVLPRIKSWLISNADLSPRNGSHALDIYLRRRARVLSFAEESTLEPVRKR